MRCLDAGGLGPSLHTSDALHSGARDIGFKTN